MFKCPLCGSAGTLATPPVEVLKEEGHRVLPGGNVQPSVECTTTGCAFHEMVKLEGYNP